MRIKKPNTGIICSFDPIKTISKSKIPLGFQFIPNKDANVYEYITIHSELTFVSEPVEAFAGALEKLHHAGDVFTYAFTVATGDEYYQTGIHIVLKLATGCNIMEDILAIKRRYLHEAKIDYNPKL